MRISHKAQLVHEFHALKALFMESSEQGDLAQSKVLMERMKDVSAQLDDLQETH